MPRNTDNFISEQFEEDLLDAYFHFRSCLPVKDEETGLDYKKSYKTTQDIATELDDMGGVGTDTINRYMVEHDYQVATQPDGTVAWAIWERVVRPDSLV
jgi:hypothetical protein